MEMDKRIMIDDAEVELKRARDALEWVLKKHSGLDPDDVIRILEEPSLRIHARRYLELLSEYETMIYEQRTLDALTK